MISYKDALRTNREKIMTLHNETVLCPGHGPITTIAEEKDITHFFLNFKNPTLPEVENPQVRFYGINLQLQSHV